MMVAAYMNYGPPATHSDREGDGENCPSYRCLATPAQIKTENTMVQGVVTIEVVEHIRWGFSKQTFL